jgi:nucleoside 2-deoxyribosyltransferase
MRGKNHLAGLKNIGAKEEDYPYDPISTASAIVSRDRNDVQTCDAMVANFLGATKASLGTAIEFGWADANNKPIIMVMGPDDKFHDHLMLTQLAGYLVPDLESCATILTHLLTPGV